MEIADIKTRLTLAQVLDHYGFKPDKHGKMNCPFHDDKTPSFQVYWKTHTCYCFTELPSVLENPYLLLLLQQVPNEWKELGRDRFYHAQREDRQTQRDTESAITDR